MSEENQSPAFELNGNQPARPLLLCFQVGECDWVAARDEDEARRALAEIKGCDPSEYADLDVELTSETFLDKQWVDEESPHAECGCLRQWLAETTEPSYLIGTEG